MDALIGRLRGDLRGAIVGRLRWLAAAALAAGGWAWLALDRWLEPSVGVRGSLLVVLIIAALLVAIVVALRRLWRPISDREVVSLLARQAPAEAALLATSLDLRQKGADAANPLVAATLREADAAAARLNEVTLVRSPERSRLVWSTRVLLGVALLAALWEPELGACYVRRLFLSNEKWPRIVTLVAEGFEYDDASGEWRRVAERGEPAELVIVASAAKGRRVPETLWARGGAAGARRTLSSLTRLGNATTSEEAPEDEETTRFRRRFERLDDDLTLTVWGGDASLRLRLVAADRPELTDWSLTVEPPSYLGARATTSSLATLSALPEGSRLVLTAKSTKPLTAVAATATSSAEVEPASIDSKLDGTTRAVSITVPPLRTPLVIKATATDTDGLVSKPIELPIDVALDTPPEVALLREGSPRSVTRDALIGVRARVDDDHGLDVVRLELRCEDKLSTSTLAAPRELPGEAAGAIDLLSLRSASPPLAVSPGDRLSLRVVASDRYDLSQREPIASQETVIEVVTPAELLAQLGDAQRELAAAVSESLSDVERLEYEVDLHARRSGGERAIEPEALRRWQAERGLDVRKVSEAIRQAAERAGAIRRQVIDNRLDQPDLVDRLDRRVARPLRRAAGESLAAVSKALSAEEPNHSVAQASLARTKSDLQRAAASLGSQESYNEVVAQLRGLIREQLRVNEKTTRQEAQSVRSLFE